jgi:1,4-alpha-glucan branching enzyme
VAGTALHSRLTDEDVYLFAEGTHGRLADKLGAHPGPGGTSFAVWAPNAARVSVVGDFNGWDPETHALEPVRSSGIWSGRVEEAASGDVYKFHVRSRHRG